MAMPSIKTSNNGSAKTSEISSNSSDSQMKSKMRQHQQNKASSTPEKIQIDLKEQTGNHNAADVKLSPTSKPNNSPIVASYPDAESSKMMFSKLNAPISFSTTATVQLKNGNISVRKLKAETNDLKKEYGANVFAITPKGKSKGNKVTHETLVAVKPLKEVSQAKLKKGELLKLSTKGSEGESYSAKATQKSKGGRILLDLSTTDKNGKTVKAQIELKKNGLFNPNGQTGVNLTQAPILVTLNVDGHPNLAPDHKKNAGVNYWITDALNALGLDNLSAIVDSQEATKPGTVRSKNMGALEIPNTPFALMREAQSTVEPKGWARKVQSAWNHMVNTKAGEALIAKFSEFPEDKLQEVELHNGKKVKLPVINMYYSSVTGEAKSPLNTDKDSILEHKVMGNILLSDSYPTLTMNKEGKLEAVANRKPESTSLFHELIHIANTKDDAEIENSAQDDIGKKRGVMSNVEEVRTIVGINEGDLCENTLLKELGMPLRYAHTTTENLQKKIDELRQSGKDDEEILATILDRSVKDESIQQHLKGIANAKIEKPVANMFSEQSPEQLAINNQKEQEQAEYMAQRKQDDNEE